MLTLVAAAQAGAAPAFGEIFERYQGVAYATAFSRLHDHELAQDVVQDAFIEAYLNLNKLREPAAFSGWLRTIVCRQCNRSTRRKRFPLVPLDDVLEIPSRDPGPDRAVEMRQQQEQLRAALSGLRDSDRRMVEMFYLEGRSCQEIGTTLGFQVATVKKRLHFARRTLRARLRGTELEMDGEMLGAGEAIRKAA